MTKGRILLFLFALAAAVTAYQRGGLNMVLPSTTMSGKQANEAYLVASEQLVRPWQLKTLIQGRPADLAIDPGGSFAAILNGNSVVTVNLVTGKELSRAAVRTTSYLGIRFRPNTKEIWASEATRNGPDALLIFHYSDDGAIMRTERITLEGHPIPAGLAFTPDGAKLYAALHHDNTIVEIDAAARRTLRRWPTDLAPFSLALDPAKSVLYVSNRGGMKRSGAATAPSGKVDLPVDANGSVLNGTVSIVDLNSGKSQSIAAGLAPAGIALSPDGKLLVVANSHSDTLTLLDTATRKAAELAIDSRSVLPGILPNHAAFHPNGERFYVALGGENAVAVFGRKGAKWELLGKVPSGWFPTAVQVDARGTVHIATVKGLGNDEQAPGQHNSRVYEGSLASVPDPPRAQLSAGMREVRFASQPRFTPNGGVKDLAKLGIRHVFLLIKENRTYDQVFADIPKGNRDRKLLMYGREVTPNHHALAERYVLLDNFYASGAISFEGHQWLMMGFVSDHVERALQAAPRGYAWNMGDSLTVSPAGFFWQDQRRPLTVRLLGPLSTPAQPDASGMMRDIDETAMLSWSEYWEHYKKGTWRKVIGSRCAVPALRPIYDEAFPPSSMRVPDVIRSAAFAERLAGWEKSGEAPNLTIVTLTSDHTMGRNPSAPRPRSMVADNDLALGEIVEGITHSRFWPNSLILAVEDDAQDGVDHVSGRRTLALAIAPTIRRGALDSNYYTQISLVRTIQEIFGIAPRTRFLAAARAMNSIFTTERDPAPYKAIKPEIRLDDMNPPASALKGRERWAAVASSQMNWNEVDDVPTGTLNRILWWDAKGFSTPYPRPLSAERVEAGAGSSRP
ncbi:MAG: bifunctional YncE family protein/alkaline phosphatase family protein [Bryobacteraceae bacterium]|nr:bifunctional YncE family protein/alkaline phosphatase family protein [Bryobacteraceae bacterium]